jgi:hypothetical protein
MLQTQIEVVKSVGGAAMSHDVAALSALVPL